MNQEKLQTVKLFLPQILHPYLSDNIEEIRFRRNREVMFLSSEKELISPVIADKAFLDDLMDRLTKSSLYTYFEDIANGFLTLEGGHRVGLCGTGIYQHGKLTDVRDISSLNFRIAREKKGCANRVFELLQQEETLPGVLIISPPGCGKTTLLRDLIRQVSDKMSKWKVAVVDQRNELSGTAFGAAQNDLGKRTDILCGYTKPDGIKRAVASLSPTLIAVDEIGSAEDEESLLFATYSGVQIFATIHGDERGAFRKNIARLIKENVFGYYIYLSGENHSDRICHIEKVKENPLC